LHRKGKTAYWVLHHDGTVREENFYNLKTVVRCPLDESTGGTTHGPSRFGQALRVEFFTFATNGDREKTTRWFRGFVGAYLPETDEYEIHWTSGDPVFRFDLRASRWFILRSSGGGHDRQANDLSRPRSDHSVSIRTSVADTSIERITRGSTNPLDIDYHAEFILTPTDVPIHEYLGLSVNEIYGPKVRFQRTPRSVL
jgi:hypothetical protein